MRLGSFCTGYGGLDMAVEHHYGATLTWYSEVDKDCNQLLDHHWPGVPNLGDLTKISFNTWGQMEPVDIMCAGFPCQPFSHAGKREGANDERAIFAYIADGISVLRPGVVVLYELQMPALLTAVRDGSASLPTPRSFMANMADRPLKIRDVYKCNLEEAIALLSTPVVNDMGAGKTIEWWDTWTEKRGNDHSSLSIEVARLLPTPRAQNGEPRNMKPWVRPLDQPQNLENAIARLLPTPTAQDGANNAGPSQWNRNSDPLNVVAVKLSGGSSPMPFNDGNEPSDGQHPHRPTTGNSPAEQSSG